MTVIIKQVGVVIFAVCAGIQFSLVYYRHMTGQYDIVWDSFSIGAGLLALVWAIGEEIK